MTDLGRRIPLNGTFELTGRCNLSCKMCLVRVDQARIRELGLRERTAEEWIDMARQAADAGTLQLLLTGGEAMMRPDFCEIYEAIAKMGFLLTVYTNATMVSDKVMELFRKYPPHKIGVTMYGASNETYERLCDMKDGFDRFCRGVDLLTELPSVFDIRTTIVQDNLNDLAAMRAYTLEKFGDEKLLHVSRFVTDSVRGGICSPKECRITPAQNVDLIVPGLREFRDKVLAGEETLAEDGAKLTIRKHRASQGYLFAGCGAGLKEFAISWAGRMYACGLLAEGYTEPFEDGFEAAWKALPDQYPEAHEIEKCGSCAYAALCETCPANRLAETGDWYGIPAYACEEAKIEYELLSDLKAF